MSSSQSSTGSSVASDDSILVESQEDYEYAAFPPYHQFKRLLQSRWGLWFYAQDPLLSWEENQRLVSTFETFGGYWSLFNKTQLPSLLPHGSDYSLFKKGIKPAWEDPSNMHGGRLIIWLQDDLGKLVDRAWTAVNWWLVREDFSFSEEVCGVVVSVRPRTQKLAVWIRNAKQEGKVRTIAYSLKEVITGICYDSKVRFQVHSESAKMGSKAPFKFVL